MPRGGGGGGGGGERTKHCEGDEEILFYFDGCSSL